MDDQGEVSKTEDFLTGFLNGETVIGRPGAPMVMKDGSLLIADDKQSIIYRVFKS